MAIYYVNELTGNDSGSGLSGDPWQTLTKVNDSMATLAGNELELRSLGSFTGNIVVTSNLLRIGVDGVGKAIIEAGNDAAITSNTPIEIENLILNGATITFAGSFPTLVASCTNTDFAIKIINITNSGGLSGGSIHNCEIHGFNSAILLATIPTSGTPTVAHSNISIHDNLISECLFSGITNWVRTSAYGYVPSVLALNITIEHNGIVNVWGISNANSAYGINGENIGGVSYIRNNYIADCGEASNQGGGGNGVGIFTSITDGAIYMYGNEIAGQRTPSGVDGSGIDIEYAANIFAYANYIHGCDGSALEAGNSGGGFQTFGNVWYMFNICVDNGNNTTSCGGIETFTTGLADLYVIFNTFYHSSTNSNLFDCDSVQFINNIFHIVNAVNFGVITNTSVLVGNTYFADTGSTFSLTINGAAKTSLAQIRSAGFETHSAVNYGFSGNPSLLSPGNQDTMWTAAVTNQDAYDISDVSSAIGTAIDPSLLSLTLLNDTDFHIRTYEDSVSEDGWTPGACQVEDPLVMPTTFFFDEGLLQLMDSSIEWTIDDIRIRLLEPGVTPDRLDTVLTGYDAVGVDCILTSKTVTSDTSGHYTIYNAANALIEDVGIGVDYGAAVVYLHVTNDGDSIPLICLAISPGTSDSDDMTLRFPAEGIARLVLAPV